jgi:hypothetical protein
MVAATEAVARGAGRASDEAAWGRPAPTLDSSAPRVAEPAAEATLQPLTREAELDRPAEESDLVAEEPGELPEEPAQILPEPAHVSEEPELVAEVAEPGAEDGAGASIAIAEPWPGYRQLTASEVISRVRDATPAELGAIELYESANRDRQTVRAAVQRNLKIKTGRGSPDRGE